jgi:6-pyruvoyltetrahydropterin/6-carboxytetrahydropterin synthase
MKIGKEYYFEMGHRLTFHQGGCINLHGHSYKLIVILQGELNENGMLIDYYELDKIVNPIIKELDHGYLVYEKDSELIESLKKLNSRLLVVNFESTAENITKYLLSKLSENNFPKNIHKLTVRVYETSDAFAEESVELK